jgi:DNA-binding CsgD family transcriptional regulator
MSLIRTSTSADITVFYQIYEEDGVRFMGDMLVGGPGEPDVPVEPVLGAPAPSGSAALQPEKARWRKGYWSPSMPLKKQRNRFLKLDEDVHRDAFKRTGLWTKVHGPAGVGDRVRALMYESDRFLGWIGAFRQGRDERFTLDERDAVNAVSEKVHALLSAACHRQSDLRDESAAYAIVDGDGHFDYATPAARHVLGDELRDAVSRLVRKLDAGSSTSPYVFWQGIQLRVVRLDGDDGVRYLSVIDRASVPALSCLHELTARQRSVAEYASVGATNREIAETLDISRNTVKHHLANIYDILGIGSRTELAEFWHRWH